MNIHLRSITNSFLDVRLASLAGWRQANEIIPRDHGGPYVSLQTGYDPDDLTMSEDEFVLGRSGKWLSLAYFYQLPVPERRAEFVFGTVGDNADDERPPFQSASHPGRHCSARRSNAAGG